MRNFGSRHGGARRIEPASGLMSLPESAAVEVNQQQRERARTRLGRFGLSVGLVAIGAVLASVALHGSKPASPAKAVPLGMATVDRRDLVETRSYTGVLSYPARGNVGLNGPGTVTSLPRNGQILDEGASVAGVDDHPIGVLFGTTSLYRTLKLANPTSAELAAQAAEANLLSAEATLSQASRPSKAEGATSPSARAASVAQADVGVDQARDRLTLTQQTLEQARTPQHGPDVALVAREMEALGYYQGSGDSWNAALEDAVRAWQQHIGAVPTGEIDPDDVLVTRGPARVSGVHGQPGSAPSEVTFSLDALTRLATFRIKNGTPAALVPGRHVTLSAAGRTTSGRVTSVTTSHQVATVRVTFAQSSRLARVASSQVSMKVTIAEHRDVLTVPTQALLALASGGYALQLPGGRLLAVRTGLVQAGDIEVSGRGVHAGLKVVSVS
jgi:hypothetical protein